MNLRHWRIRTKLAAAFGMLALAALIVSVLSVRSVTTEHEAFKRYVSDTDVRQKLATAVLDAANARAIAARNLVLVSAAADRDMEQAAATQAHATVGRRLAQLKDALARGAGVEDEERRLFADIEAVEAKYGALALAIMDLALKDQREQAIARMNAECRPLLAALVAAAQRYAQHGAGRAAAEVADTEAQFRTGRALLVATCTASLLLVVGMGWALTRAITRPIERAVHVARTVAAGNLGSAIETGGRDETGQLLAALKAMNDSLAGIVANVRQTSDSITAGSQQIASGNADLSQRTERQAANLQQTAAAREIKGLIGASVDRVETGSRLAGHAGDAMQDIVGQVRRVADLIRDISHSASEQTGGIGQVNDAVARLDESTQQNAALVEQSAAAADSLRQQAARLSEAVSVFKVA